MNTQKVVNLSPDSIYEHLQTYLNLHRKASKNTAETYERSIIQFFNYFNKDVRFLMLSDLDFSRKQIIDYQTKYLYDKMGYSYGTIQLKMAPLRGFYKYLKSNKINVHPEIFQVEKFPNIKKPFGFISFDEGILLAELALTERELKYEKHTLLLLALYTSFRRSALFSITPNHIRPSEYNKGRYIISIFDKGRQVEEEINQDLYDKLMFIKKGDNDTPFFNMTFKTINTTIKRLAKKAGFDPKRRISLHSFKKGGVNETYEATGDIHAAQKQGKHKNIQTTLNYINRKPNNILLDIAEDRNIPDEIFDKLSREELIQLLKETTNGTKITLKRKAKELVSRKEAN